MLIIEYLYNRYETVDIDTLKLRVPMDLSNINLFEPVNDDFKENLKYLEKLENQSIRSIINDRLTAFQEKHYLLEEVIKNYKEKI